jgi:FkbM family methyltransferase
MTYLNQLTEVLKFYITPTNFIEVGSMHGDDAKYVSDYWNLDKESTYIIEANPYHYNDIVAKYQDKFTILNVAASNINGLIDFNCIKDSNKDIEGASSILEPLYIKGYYKEIVQVKQIRLDLLKPFELMKIDVEGYAYEVLIGMGENIREVKAIQVETESIPCFKGQKIDEDVSKYMNHMGFELVDKQRCWNVQYDCLYINKRQIY